MSYQINSRGDYLRTSDGAVIPVDPDNRDYQEYLKWLSDGNTLEPIPGPTPQELQAAVVDAVQTRLDDFAKTRGYDSILSACTYATSRIPKFAAEGQYAVDVRDHYWAGCYTILGEVVAGVRPMPASADEVLALLPPLEWLTE
jgi:hypothetical protein